MCWRPGCLFKDSPRARARTIQEGRTKLLIIGASGMTGAALVDAAVSCVWFHVVALTRNLENLRHNSHVKSGSVQLVEGDMLEVKSLHRAMKNVDVVFFSTAYWDTMDSECEYNQGCNVVNAAVKARIKHILYVGTPYCDQSAPTTCKYLVGRERVQNLVISSNLPWTIFHMGFYYENFMSVFRPHLVEQSTYALALPMGNIGINCGSVLDFAHCIAKVILQPGNHIGNILRLSTGYHTVTQLAAWVDRHYKDLTFYDPKIPMDEYRAMSFSGSEELSAMFTFLQSYPNLDRWDQRLSYELCPSARSFKDWLTENEKGFLMCLEKDEETEGQPAQLQVVEPSPATSGSSMLYSSCVPGLQKLGQRKIVNTMAIFHTIEENVGFERRAATCDQLNVRQGFVNLWRMLLDSDG